MPPINRPTFNEERERSEQDGTELRLGAILKFLWKVPEEMREQNLPVGETQANSKMDTMSCASIAPNEELERNLTYAYRNNLMKPETKAWLDKNDCVVMRNGLAYVETSDAWTAIKSGTTLQGNSLKAPCQSLHEDGFVPKKWMPLEDWMTWKDYHNPARITQKIRDFAQESKQRLPIKYQQVQSSEFISVLTRSGLSVAVSAWDAPVNGIYQRTNAAFNHAVNLFKNRFFARDSYPPYNKQLAPDFRFFDWGYEIGFVEENVIAEAPDVPSLSFLQQIAKVLTAIRDYLLLNPPATPVPAPTPSPVPIPSRLDIWARAIAAEESSKPPRPTDVNIRLKNPGNLKFTTYTQSLGSKSSGEAYIDSTDLVGGRRSAVPGLDGGTFCEFETYEKGFTALKQFLLDAVNGNLKAYEPTDTLKKFTQTYANPPNLGYATNVAKKLGCTIETKIKDIL